MKKPPANTTTNSRSYVSQLYLLTKPGIVYGNLFAAIAGYFLAAPHTPIASLFGLVAGLGFVLASAGYANSIMDLRIDRLMKRTEKRPLVTGAVSVPIAYIGAFVFLAGGLYILYALGNQFAALLGFIGWFGYLFVYGHAKRHTHHSTLVGAFPGALPPLIGYVYATGNIDLIGAILFIMMFFWQMPHFYGISIFRRTEYAAAGVPILPLVKGELRTLYEMRAYVMLYALACLCMVIAATLDVIPALILLVSALWWCGVVAGNIVTGKEEQWARRVFKVSLFILLLWPIVFGLNHVI